MAKKEGKTRDRDWTRRRLDWIDRISSDLRVSDKAFRLAHVLGSRYMNPATGDAWPSQETLAEVLGLSTDRQVRNLLSELIEFGHLTSRRGGKGKPNRYAMTGNQTSDQEALMTGSSISGQGDKDGELDRKSDDPLTGNQTSGESHVDSRVYTASSGGRSEDRPAQGSARHLPSESSPSSQSPTAVHYITAGPDKTGRPVSSSPEIERSKNAYARMKDGEDDDFGDIPF